MSRNISLTMNELKSNFDWACPPDLVTVTIDEDMLQRAATIAAFLKRESAEMAMISGGFSFDAYEQADDDAVVDLWHDGVGYVFFDGYDIGHGATKVFSDGMIRAVFRLRHSNDSFWCDLGTVNDLQRKLEAEQACAA